VIEIVEPLDLIVLPHLLDLQADSRTARMYQQASYFHLPFLERLRLELKCYLGGSSLVTFLEHTPRSHIFFRQTLNILSFTARTSLPIDPSL